MYDGGDYLPGNRQTGKNQQGEGDIAYLSSVRPQSLLPFTPGFCRFAQVCDIGPRDFFAFGTLLVPPKATLAMWFDRLCVAWAPRFFGLCVDLFFAEKHCFEHKSQFLTLKY